MPDGTNPKSTPASPVQKYKAMKKIDTIMVQKDDGTIGPWGNDIPAIKKQMPPKPREIPLSDKAKGLSNSYFPPNNSNQGPSVPTQYPSRRF